MRSSDRPARTLRLLCTLVRRRSTSCIPRSSSRCRVRRRRPPLQRSPQSPPRLRPPPLLERHPLKERELLMRQVRTQLATPCSRSLFNCRHRRPPQQLPSPPLLQRLHHQLPPQAFSQQLCPLLQWASTSQRRAQPQLRRLRRRRPSRDWTA